MKNIFRNGVIVFTFFFFKSCITTHSKRMSINVPIVNLNDSLTFDNVSQILEQNTNLYKIDQLTWKTFLYQPHVSFRIAHCDSLLFLKYYVEEEHILAQKTEVNSAVHLDSCVEFFIDPLQDGNYYNFEFNCIGTTHLAYGPNRKDRQFIPTAMIKDRINTWSTLGKSPFDEKSGLFKWEMVVVIPTSIFKFNNGFNFSKMTSNANFYKCGDNTSQQHFLSWNPVYTKDPDFHRPEYFGVLKFH